MSRRRKQGRAEAPKQAEARSRPARTLAFTLAAVVVTALSAAGVYWAVRGNDRWSAAALPRGNVLLLTLDTVRADRLMPPMRSRIAPALDQLAATGHVYQNAYSHAPLTLPAHASILTGLLPPAHGVRGNGSFRLDSSIVTLAERLRDTSYSTGAFVGAFVLDPRFGLDQGFDVYDGVADERNFAHDFGFAERRAARVLASASRWIMDVAAHDRPWFAWVHLFDAHAPYDAPASLVENPYDNEIAYLDREIGTFLGALRTGGALDRTLIVVTSDHGEGLGEHREKTHGLFVYDSTARVPLIVHGPGLGHGAHSDLATHVDIVPTILDVVGVHAGGDSGLQGGSLRLRHDSARTAYVEAMDGWLTAGAAPVMGLIESSWKLIESPEPELYDLAADPGEQHNRFAGEPERVRELERRMEGFKRSVSRSTPHRQDPDADARLRALGYASSGPPASRPFSLADDAKAVRPIYERFLDVLAQPGPSQVDGLRAIVEDRPAFIAARLTAASLLIESGRPADAIALLENEARKPDAAITTRERFGAALLADGRAAAAEKVLAEATAHPDASADAWNALGVARAVQNAHRDAVTAFDRAIALAPQASRYLFNRALSRGRAGDGAGAHDDLERLTRRQPDFTDGWRALADVRYRAGDRVGAVTAWRRVVDLAPGDLDALFNAAVTLSDLGQTAEARRLASRFIERASPERDAREIATLRPLLR